MAELIGNRYELVKLIGRGGMADVYLAYDIILKREVAVKIMKSDMADDPLALERFNREAGAVTQLSHPNIVDVYDVGDDHDKHYIVMEYIKGYTLKQLIKKRGPIPYKEAVWMIKQLASALMEAHRNNVIHRDVKSQNVLIKDDGTVKLSDFGIALANGAMQITKKDSVLGSVHYLAPEVSQGKQASMQSDIYSLGIVFYELLTGDVPYKADTPVQVALQHIKGTIPSVRSINPEIPQSVENIIIKSTAKSLNNRYKNIALMIKDLNSCLKKEHLNDPKYDFNQKIPNQNVHISDVANNKEPRSIFSTLFLIIVSIISIFALLAVLYLSGIIGNRTKYSTVPNLTGMTVQEAKDLLAKNGLEVDDSRITWTLNDDIEKDLIISSVPAAEEKIERGSKVKIVVSSGIYSTLDDYVGKDYKKSLEELKSLNFKVKVLLVASDKEDGIVLEQSIPAGTKYDASLNNEITLKYARESNVLLDPSLMGQSIDVVKEYFETNGITKYYFDGLGKEYFTEEELEKYGSGKLIRCMPELGTMYSTNSDIEVVVEYYEGD